MAEETENIVPPKTRECPKCDVVLAVTEEKCPGCGIDIAEFEDAMLTVDEATKALEKKRKKAVPVSTLEIKPSKFGKLASLGRMMKGAK